jgi:quercetin dioxygenase-like cupin family protein
MNQKTRIKFVLACCISVLFITCNQQSKTEEQAKTGTASMPVYDAAMDPVNVEAPFLKLHKDTLGIKLYEVTLKPGDSVGLHTHPDNVLFVAQGGTIKIYPKEGEPQTAELPTGAAMISPAQTHSGINTGTTTVKLVVADIYRPRS